MLCDEIIELPLLYNWVLRFRTAEVAIFIKLFAEHRYVQFIIPQIGRMSGYRKNEEA